MPEDIIGTRSSCHLIRYCLESVSSRRNITTGYLRLLRVESEGQIPCDSSGESYNYSNELIGATSIPVSAALLPPLCDGGLKYMTLLAL